MKSFQEVDIRLFNSLTGKKEKFEPINESHVGIYVCGPTVYSNVHLGNCRTFLSFDLIVRFFKYLGYKVRYVRNITDAGHLENDSDSGEDKISKKARIEMLEPMEIVQSYTVDFHRIMEMFNALPPNIEPTATGHIIEQIEMIKKIIDKDMAYVANGSVYFDVLNYREKGGDYGVLSGRDIEELLAGSRELEGQEEKKNPFDFALWKKASPEHIMKWPSPWSDGFPGWHLECSAMGVKYLGEQFDIHGGGMDLKFPHHECEIAQGKAANDKAPVKYWMHANMLTLNGKRMSKSTGNTLLPMELLTGKNDILSKAFSPMVVRFFMLQAHYSSTLDFTNEALIAAEKGFNKLLNAIKLIQELDASNFTSGALNAQVQKWSDDCYMHMADDFNSPKTIAVLFDMVGFVNTTTAENNWNNITIETYKLLHDTLTGFVFDVFGLKIEQTRNEETVNNLVKLLIDLRGKAKAEKNYALSDQIRDELNKLGVVIKDSKEGTSFSLV